MPSRVLSREVCFKKGCILTCYVNGRKRFRAVAVVPVEDPMRRTSGPRFGKKSHDL